MKYLVEVKGKQMIVTQSQLQKLGKVKIIKKIKEKPDIVIK